MLYSQQEAEKLKPIILAGICYTDLVYDRINKKLKRQWTQQEIEIFVVGLIEKKTSLIYKKGKNYYFEDQEKGIQITVNANNFRVITATLI